MVEAGLFGGTRLDMDPKDGNKAVGKEILVEDMVMVRGQNIHVCPRGGDRMGGGKSGGRYGR